MATKRTSEKDEKKVTKKSPAKASEKKPAKKPAKTSDKPAVKTQKTESLVEENINIEDLQNEIEKLKAELSIIKQFKNNSDKSSSDKIFIELEKLKEILYGLEDRVEELEYQISEKEDY